MAHQDPLLSNDKASIYSQLMKIAATGGTGFIGSHFLKQALAEGHNVLAIRRSSNSQPNSSRSRTNWLDRQLMKFALSAKVRSHGSFSRPYRQCSL